MDGVWTVQSLGRNDREEAWSFKNGIVQTIKVGDETLAAEDPRAGLLGPARNGRGELFPGRFRFSPLDGQRLAHETVAEPTQAPCLAADGVARLPAGRPDRLSRRVEELPGGVVSICAAGTPTALYALTTSGDVEVALRDFGDWERVVRLQPDLLPSYARSAAGTRQGLGAIFGQSAAFLHLPMFSPKSEVERREVEGGRPLGGVGLTQAGEVAYPILVGDEIELLLYDPQVRSWNSLRCALRGPAPEALAPPVMTRSGDLLWLGPVGFLRYRPTTFALELDWIRFPPGVTAFPRTRIYAERNGHAWALSTSQEDGYAFISLAAAVVRHPVAGPHIGRGRETYYGKQCFDPPWEQPIAELVAGSGDGTFVLPLTTDDRRSDRGSSLIATVTGEANLPVLVEKRAGATLDADLFWQHRGSMQFLDETLELREFSDIITVNWSKRLLVGSTLTNKFVSWAFE